MADDEINPLGTPTTNYGWIKPTVGGDDDAWGGLLNTDLDGIDSTVKSVSTVANAAYPASNPAGYITASAIPAPYVLPTASTTILGGVKVDGSTVTAAGDGTLTSHASGGIPEAPTDGKLYSRQNSAWTPTVVPLGDNRIINGDMRIAQRGTSGTAAQYTVDRWAFGATLATKGTWSQQVNAPPPSEGFPYSLTFVSNSSYSAVAADQFIFFQPIEADQISDFQFGSVNAKSVTLSFWVYASVSGTFSGALQNYTQTRAYPFSYSVPAVNTWTKIAVTIPGDTGGTWVMSGNGGGLFVIFDLGSGATFRGPANAWASASYNGVTGAKSIVSTSGATFYLTGVKLEIGSVATPFNRQSLAKSMADCQRYYQQFNTVYCSGYTLAGQYVANQFVFQTAMRAAPTVTPSGITYTNASGLVINNIDPLEGRSNVLITATGSGSGIFSMAASAEL